MEDKDPVVRQMSFTEKLKERELGEATISRLPCLQGESSPLLRQGNGVFNRQRKDTLV